MVEYHGWMTLRDSPAEADDVRTQEIAARLEKTIRDLQAPHRILGIRVVNATYIVWMAGCTNHWSSDVDEVFDLLKVMARDAPGSYGLLYVWDDESQPENAFCVWRLAKGQLTRHDDSLLSPCVPTIEDEDD